MKSRSVLLLFILCSILSPSNCRTRAELEPSDRVYYESLKEAQEKLSGLDSNKDHRSIKSAPINFGFSKFSKDSSKHLFEGRKFFLPSMMPKYKPDNLVPSSTYTLLCLAGLYLVLLAYKSRRIAVIILGFYTVYFWMVFTIVQAQMYRSELISYQFVSYSIFVVLSFAVSIMTSLHQRIEYFVTGMATAAAFSLYLAQFCMNLSTFEGVLWFMSIFSVAAIAFGVAYAYSEFYVLQHICPFIGSSVMSIYVGIIMGDIESIEYDEEFNAERIDDFWKYLLASLLIGCAGLYLQTRQQMKEADKLKEDVLNELSDFEGWTH